MATKQPKLKSGRLFCLGAFQQMVRQCRQFRKINQMKQVIVIEWGKLSQAFDRSRLWSVASPAWVRSSAARRRHWTFNV